MNDAANWGFAAVVAAVCIGLGGLLLFTIIGAFGAWRMYEAASIAATQAARAAAAIEELGRSLVLRAPPAPGPAPSAPGETTLAEAADALRRMRDDAAELLHQQEALADAVRNLVQAGVLSADQSDERLREVEQTLRRVEEQLVRMTTQR